MTEYKALLHMWHKGTGGGPGLNIYFESWSKEKKEKYNIDTNTYNHSNVAGRPAILIENYSQDTVKKPYLTVIHMWGEQTANLLSSKHDPFTNKKGEIGMSLSSDDDNYSYELFIMSKKDRAVTATPTYGMKRRKK